MVNVNHEIKRTTNSLIYNYQAVMNKTAGTYWYDLHIVSYSPHTYNILRERLQYYYVILIDYYAILLLLYLRQRIKIIIIIINKN